MRGALKVVLVCTVMIAGLIGSNTAFARPTKIALTKIEGDAGGVGKSVSDALEESELVIVPARQVSRVVERLGLEDNFGDRGAARLVEELEVDALVRPAYDRRSRTMKFTIFAAGRRAKPFSVPVEDAASDKFHRLIRKTVMDKLATAMSADPDREEAVAEVKPKKGAKDAKDTKEAKKSKKDVEADAEASDSGAVTSISDVDAKGKSKGKAGKDETVAAETTKKAKAEREDAAEVKESRADAKKKAAEDAVAAEDTATKKASRSDDEERPAKRTSIPDSSEVAESKARERPGKRTAARDDIDDVEPSVSARGEREQGGPRSANFAAVRADLGVSMAGRTLNFQSTGTATAPSFTSNMVAGARFEGSIYPMALKDASSPLANIGIAGDFDQAVGLTMSPPVDATASLPVTDRHFSIGVRYRLPFGRTPTSPTLTLGVGYAERMFMVDRSKLTAGKTLDLPDVNYKMVDPGVAFRMPIGRRAAATVAGRGFLVTDAGPIQQPDQYGTTTLLGGTASAGVEVMLFGDRVAARLVGEATQLNLDFKGNGALNNRDDVASTIEVKKATDRWIGAAATIAVLY